MESEEVNKIFSGILLRWRKLTKDELQALPDIIDTKFGFKSRTLLHCAAQMGDVSMLNFLLNMGASVKVEDSDGNLPIHLSKTAVITKMLIGSNAKFQVNEVNKRNMTPLHLAVINKNYEVVKYLFGIGADQDIRSKPDGKTPLELRPDDLKIQKIFRPLPSSKKHKETNSLVMKKRELWTIKEEGTVHNDQWKKSLDKEVNGLVVGTKDYGSTNVNISSRGNDSCKLTDKYVNRVEIRNERNNVDETIYKLVDEMLEQVVKTEEISMLVNELVDQVVKTKDEERNNTDIDVSRSAFATRSCSSNVNILSEGDDNKLADKYVNETEIKNEEDNVNETVSELIDEMLEQVVRTEEISMLVSELVDRVVEIGDEERNDIGIGNINRLACNIEGCNSNILQEDEGYGSMCKSISEVENRNKEDISELVNELLERVVRISGKKYDKDCVGKLVCDTNDTTNYGLIKGKGCELINGCCYEDIDGLLG